MANGIVVRVGDYVRVNLGAGAGKSVHRVSRVWTIDRGPDKGRVKASAHALVDVRGYRGLGASWIGPIDAFEPFPYAGPEIPC